MARRTLVAGTGSTGSATAPSPTSMTAWANDISYEGVFAARVAALVRPGDVVVAISASGNLPNVLAYNPLDYQVGSVWPHDNALIALGMRRWGLTRHMESVITGIFQAATRFSNFRLPEVFDGFGQSQYGQPVEYPVACSPQAWAAGALPLLLQTALGLQPHALERTLHVHRPHLPVWLTDVAVRALRIGGASVDLRYQRDGDTTLVASLKRTGDLDVTVAY